MNLVSCFRSCSNPVVCDFQVSKEALGLLYIREALNGKVNSTQLLCLVVLILPSVEKSN